MHNEAFIIAPSTLKMSASFYVIFVNWHNCTSELLIFKLIFILLQLVKFGRNNVTWISFKIYKKNPSKWQVESFSYQGLAFHENLFHVVNPSILQCYSSYINLMFIADSKDVTVLERLPFCLWVYFQNEKYTQSLCCSEYFVFCTQFIYEDD